MNTVVAFGHNRLDHIKRRIIDARIRVVRGGSEWIEGSLEIAIAMREGRDAVPENISFSGWLKQNNLNYYDKNDRAALIGMASDIELARTVLAESSSRSYQMIWTKHKNRFPSVRKKPTVESAQVESSPTNRKRRHMPGRAQLFRTMKLGDEAMNKIKGTSLDSSDELDELVMLNRGAPEGKLTEVVARLIDDAARGEPVSAIVKGVEMGGGRRGPVKPQLMAAWNHRMIVPWKLAKPDERVDLVRLLLKDLDQDQQNNVITHLWDEEKEGRT